MWEMIVSGKVSCLDYYGVHVKHGKIHERTKRMNIFAVNEKNSLVAWLFAGMTSFGRNSAFRKKKNRWSMNKRNFCWTIMSLSLEDESGVKSSFCFYRIVIRLCLLWCFCRSPSSEKKQFLQLQTLQSPFKVFKFWFCGLKPWPWRFFPLTFDPASTRRRIETFSHIVVSVAAPIYWRSPA